MKALTLRVLKTDDFTISYREALMSIAEQPKGGSGIGAWDSVDDLRMSLKLKEKVQACEEHSLMQLENDDYDFLRGKVRAFRMWAKAHPYVIQFIDDVEKGEDSMAEIR